MRTTTHAIRIFVSILFIISGLVKANDPLGLSYKMEEFFEVWNASLSIGNFFLESSLISLFNYLHEHSLTLSLLMISLEIMAGAALLVGWSKRFTLWLLFLLILFFTFLTGYAYASGKFKNCGCFGDCLPITPLSSFLKDILLLILIVWLIINQRYIRPLATKALRTSILMGCLVLSIGLQWYVLNYLPIKDCLPFKVGNNISNQMKIPEGAVPDSFAIRFVYERGGKQFEFSPADLPSDLDQYKFVNRTDKLIRQGNAEAPIKAFSLVTINGEDSTQALLNDSQYTIWYFINPDSKSLAQLNSQGNLIEQARKKNIKVYLITNMGDELQKIILGLPILKCDVTVFRTAARTNPCIFLMKGGTILNKWSSKNASKAINTINNLPVQTASVAKLDTIELL
ncbi:MAG: DoxX family protein [Chitinophagaceae bacterium]